MNQHLAKLKDTMKSLEQKIDESKKTYSASLKRLEELNTEMHERRGTYSRSVKSLLDPRKVASTGNTPEMRRASKERRNGEEDLRSVDSLQIAADFTGSTGSLPSIGLLSNSQSPSSDSDSKSLDLDNHLSHHERNSPNPVSMEADRKSPENTSPASSYSSCSTGPNSHSQNSQQESVTHVASDLVIQCLATAVHRISQEDRSSNGPLS